MAIFDEEETFDEDGDEFAGYTVIDENEEYRRKIASRFQAEPEIETIATPIPQNEQTVLVDNAHFFALNLGAPLKLTVNENNAEYSAAVFANSEKVADLKPAYVKKLLAERGGTFASAFVHDKTPAMIKLVFAASASDTATLLPKPKV